MTRSRLVPGQPLAQDLRLDQLQPLAFTTASGPVSTVVTASGTPHTKGAWVQLVASTVVQADGIELFLRSDTSISGAVSGVLMDLGFGGVGSEVVMIPNIQVGSHAPNNLLSEPLGRFPLNIPMGTALSLRCQSLTASATAGIGHRLLRSSRKVPAPVGPLLALGADTATSQGVAPTIASANTKGGWTQVVASVPFALRGLVLHICASDTTMGTSLGMVDIGVGASGSEVVVVPDIVCDLTASESFRIHNPGYYPVNIPAGARIAVRYSSGTTNNGSIGVSLTGIPA